MNCEHSFAPLTKQNGLAANLSHTKMPRKQRLASTISECKEDEVLDRRFMTAVFKTQQLGSDSRRPPRNELQDSQAQSNATEVRLLRSRSTCTAVLQRSYRESCPETPLKGTPWEDAGFSSVTLISSSCSPRKNRSLTRQSSAKDEEAIADFWMNFFG